ncbi:hypothetical protein ECSE_P4-0003 (plasmid) [Escherichia coli SE11]|uniref:Uncharacterized protein n=1 Tax=Escherichia coli (strain SE11) TaxID=409438 RepID=A0A979GK13_ECOSE|nr:hypothetical protein ECSE_P4-0003 [Escherichia coli SE11]
MICCWFWLTAAPFAAKLSGAVRATDVMVNKSDDEATIRLNLCYLIAHDYDMCINYLGKYAFACYH